jgi:hypothetical protein
VLAALTMAAAHVTRLSAEPWPYMPFNEPHGLGNHYGEFQNYGSGPYYHDGIDLVTPAGPEETYSVSDGTLTHITYSDPWYSGIMIGQPAPEGLGWLYWHISSATMQFDIGDEVGVNDYIGTTAAWPVASFHHVHFNKVRGEGGYPWSWYTSIDNPLAFMTPHTDDVSPAFETTYQGRRFAFVAQASGGVVDPDALSGSVDIVAKISDVVGLPQWRLNPWRIEAWLYGATQSIPATTAVTFSGQIPGDGTVGVIYRLQSPMPTEADYDNRSFYFIVSNTDGDGYVESSDAARAWNTSDFDPGDYWVFMRASDLGGNATTDSMRCTVAGILDVDVALPEPSHDFGMVAVGSTSSWGMEVRNLGSDYLSVRTLGVTAPEFAADRSHFFVAPFGADTVVVSFMPQEPGVHEAFLALTTNDPDEPSMQVVLHGEAGAGPMVLSGLVEGSNLTLTWSPVGEAASFWVFGAPNLPWFSPGSAPGYQFRLDILPSGATTWLSGEGIGDPDVNWTYLVTAVNESESELARSNRVGEAEFGTDIP